MVNKKLVAIISIAVAIGTATTTYSLQKAAEQPVVIQAVSPVFSNYQAQIPRANRDVVIRVKIDPTGNVISAEIVSGIDVNSKAKQAALRWRFNALENGKGERTVSLKFNYRLMPEEAEEEDITAIFKPPYEIEVRRRERIIRR